MQNSENLFLCSHGFITGGWRFKVKGCCCLLSSESHATVLKLDSLKVCSTKLTCCSNIIQHVNYMLDARCNMLASFEHNVGYVG